jgi:hypothetical protein
MVEDSRCSKGIYYSISGTNCIIHAKVNEKRARGDFIQSEIGRHQANSAGIFY